MARGRKSALGELVRAGLVADGELLRYKVRLHNLRDTLKYRDWVPDGLFSAAGRIGS